MATDVPLPQKRHIPRHAPAKSSKAKRGFFRRFWWVFVLTPFVMVAMGMLALLVAYQRIELPSALPPIRTSYLYDRDGNQLASLHGAVDRTIVPLNKISPNLQDAVIATEDAGFYNHPGVDIKGIFRAAWTDLVKRGTVQGASTLTEQLVKNVYAGQYVRNADGTTDYVIPPRTIKEKIREGLLAIKLEQTYTKDQILAKYLNTVYFGHGAYGAEAAAQTYFGKPASELTVLESASLAGVLHAPSLYDPIASPYDNKFRRDYSLDQMVRYGYLDAAKAATLKQHKCCGTVSDAGDNIQAKDGAAYFVDYARQALFDRYGSAKVYGGGLDVTTSLDPQMQHAAWAAVRKDLPFTKDNPSAAVVSIDPQTGEVLAMVGGRDFNKSQLNLATLQGGSGRQSGSAFKAFTLTAALENGYSLNSYWQGPSSITIPQSICNGPTGPWTPVNAGDGEAGTFTLLQATEHSVNTVFAQVIAQLTPPPVVDAAHRLGIRSYLPDACSITLGSVAVNPLEMTNAYATLAASGMRHWATPFVSVDNSAGSPIDDVASKGKQVVEPNYRERGDLRAPLRRDRRHGDLGEPRLAGGGRQDRHREPERGRLVLRLHRAARHVRLGGLAAGRDPAREHHGRSFGLRGHDPRADLARLHGGGHARRQVRVVPEHHVHGLARAADAGLLARALGERHADPEPDALPDTVAHGHPDPERDTIAHGLAHRHAVADQGARGTCRGACPRPRPAQGPLASALIRTEAI